MFIQVGAYDVPVNEDLLEKNNVKQNLYDIVCVRIKIQKLLDKEKENVYIDRESELMDELTSLEYELQTLWGFKTDKNYHSYQWGLKNCSCPRMDNLDRLGLPSKVINPTCPYHGKGLK